MTHIATFLSRFSNYPDTYKLILLNRTQLSEHRVLKDSPMLIYVDMAYINRVDQRVIGQRHGERGGSAELCTM